jgi:steroid delta-isomerase-like uncharacterized protein
MKRIKFSLGGGIRPAVLVLLGLVLSAVAFTPNALVAAPALGGTTVSSPAQEARAAEQETRDANRRPVPRVVRQWADAWNNGSPERMAALFTDDGTYEDHAFQVAFHGKDGVAQWVSITTGAIDETHVEVTRAFRGGDRIAVEWTFSGKNTAGGLAGLPPTGKSFSVPAVSIFEMEGNEIRRVDDYYNLADLLRQVGLPSGAWVPPPA